MRLPALSSPALALLGGVLCLPSVAQAGGIGVMATAGGHSDRVDSYTYDETTAEYTQHVESQTNSNMGAGVELILGDKDNKILGIFRAYYMSDAPQQKPAEGSVYAIREEPRPIGVINAGLQWGVIGDPQKLQLVVVSTLGSGFMTTDQTEFITAEVGVGGTYMLARKMQLALNVTGGTRYRKIFYPTVNGYLGVRYLFD